MDLISTKNINIAEECVPFDLSVRKDMTSTYGDPVPCTSKSSLEEQREPLNYSVREHRHFDFQSNNNSQDENERYTNNLGLQNNNHFTEKSSVITNDSSYHHTSAFSSYNNPSDKHSFFQHYLSTPYKYPEASSDIQPMMTDPKLQENNYFPHPAFPRVHPNFFTNWPYQSHAFPVATSSSDEAGNLFSKNVEKLNALKNSMLNNERSTGFDKRHSSYNRLHPSNHEVMKHQFQSMVEESNTVLHQSLPKESNIDILLDDRLTNSHSRSPRLAEEGGRCRSSMRNRISSEERKPLLKFLIDEKQSMNQFVKDREIDIFRKRSNRGRCSSDSHNSVSRSCRPASFASSKSRTMKNRQFRNSITNNNVTLDHCYYKLDKEDRYTSIRRRKLNNNSNCCSPNRYCHTNSYWSPKKVVSRRQKKRCSYCLNHNLTVLVKGHKGKCPFKECKCKACGITRSRQLHVMREHRNVREREIAEVNNQDAIEEVYNNINISDTEKSVIDIE